MFRVVANIYRAVLGQFFEELKFVGLSRFRLDRFRTVCIQILSVSLQMYSSNNEVEPITSILPLMCSQSASGVSDRISKSVKLLFI